MPNADTQTDASRAQHRNKDERRALIAALTRAVAHLPFETDYDKALIAHFNSILARIKP